MKQNLKKKTLIAKKLTTALLLLFFLFIASGCSKTITNITPSNKAFPSVKGDSLDGKLVNIPEDLKGAPAILLVGYTQKTQFDIDRWILGLKQIKSQAKILELPTIPGLLPGLAADFISNGMKRGIPREDWPSVVTVFSDGDKIMNVTGNENPNNARVFLLDNSGNIAWFYDRGYSADQIMNLEESFQKLSKN